MSYKAKQGDLIVLNRLDDAVLWRVVNIDMNQCAIVDQAIEHMPNVRRQYTHICNCMKPNKKQLDQLLPKTSKRRY